MRLGIRILIFFCAAISCINSFASVNSTEKDLRKQYISAVRLINEKNYKEALKHFVELEAQINTANIQYHIGLCYLKSPVKADKIFATTYFEKVLPAVSEKYVDSFDEVNAPMDTYYYLAESYLIQSQAEKSIQLLGIYKNSVRKDKEAIQRANELLNSCEKLKSNFIFAQNNTYLINKINRLPLNVNTAERAKANNILRYTKDYKLIYSTSDEKIYYLKQNTSTGKWENPIEISFDQKLDNTKSQERVYVAKSTKGQNSDLYESNYNSDKLSAPVMLNENVNSKSDEMSACVSLDGNILYFSSNRKGGYGGFDIYKVEKMNTGEWGKAQNLGPSVNSEQDEITPFLLQDGATLFFSSKGHRTLGGYDIFSSTLSEDGFWSNAENIGFPINTVKDDSNYCLSTDENNAFYISSKDNDDYDIFQVELNK